MHDKKLSEAKLQQLTKILIDETEALEKVFHHKKIEPDHSQEFFDFVKENTKEQFNHLDAWLEAIEAYLEDGNKIIHEEMIDSTADNMKALIMHSYYKDVRKRRYMEIKRSCLYVFQAVLKGIED